MPDIDFNPIRFATTTSNMFYVDYERISEALRGTSSWQQVGEYDYMMNERGEMQVRHHDDNVFPGDIGDIPEKTQDMPKAQRREIIKELEMDAEDLLYHIIQGTPRVIGLRYYRADQARISAAHRYQREQDMQNGHYFILNNSHNILAELWCRPHLRVTLAGDLNPKRREYFAMRVLERVLFTKFPKAKVRREDDRSTTNT